MNPNDIVTWPDLSHYGITLGVVRLADGKNKLVFADESNRYGHIARNMGFSKTRWSGLWVRDNLTVIPGMFASVFPRVGILRKTNTEISQEVMAVVRRKTAESAAEKPAPSATAAPAASAPQATPQAGAAQPAAQPAAAGAAVAEVDLAPLIAEAMPIGSNMLGEHVFQSPNGSRFVRITSDDGGKPSVVMESSMDSAFDGTQARFLRAPNDVALELCAEGFVKFMDDGHIARADEFRRFFHAVTGREAAENDPEVVKIAAEIDRVRARKLFSKSKYPNLEAFEHATVLHERCQYYSLVKSGRMTPLPVGVVMQSICATQAEQSLFRILSEDRGEHSALLESLFERARDEDSPDILVASFGGGELPQKRVIDGIEVARLDHSAMLDALKSMPDDGLGVFLIDGDSEPGAIGGGSRRFLDHVASHFAIEGIVDVDGALTGASGSTPRRLVVVGKRREEVGHAGLPPRVPHVVDFNALWAWGAKVSSQVSRPGSVPIAEIGGVSKDFSAEQNIWQAPYIPSSTLSDPALMVPRNMAAPTRRALLKVTDNGKVDIDEFLMKELGYESREDLREALDAEQADAVALGIYRMKSGLGYMEADQTGIGKGRVLAALARWARRQGIPVIFCTERAELFTDFYRDIEDTKSQEYFMDMFVLNDGPDSAVKSMQTGEIVARSAPKGEVAKVMRSMKMPDADIVFCTYSQFNRDPGSEIQRALSKSGALKSGKETIMENPMLNQLMQERASDERKFDLKTAVVIKADEALDDSSMPEIVPVSALKSLWIGRAPENALLIMDESHVAAGETSQTNSNMMHAVMKAKYMVGSSATFARGESNMRIYRRNFPASVDVEALHITMKKGGEPLQEVLSSMLAEDGGIIRREHDLSMVEFVPDVDSERVDFNRELSDQFAEVLAALAYFNRQARTFTDAVSKELKEKLEKSGNSAAAKTAGVNFNSGFGSRMYLLVKQFLTILKVERTVELSLKSLQEGRKPVIVISHTMESSINQALSAAAEAGDASQEEGGKLITTPSFRDLLLRTLERMMDVKLDDQQFDLKKSPDVAEAIRAVEEKIRAFPHLTISPIDSIHQALSKAGYNGAEISGRKSKLIDLENGKTLVASVPGSERKSAKDRFNNGLADYMVLSPAGNSGISLHASPRFLDTKQREMIELEVPEDVVVRTQFFGRVNRKGQVCPPIITTMSSGLPAENRIIAMQNQGLRKLSANITSNRDNAAITGNVPDVLNSIGNEVCFRFLERNPALAQKLDIDMPDAYEMAMNMFFMGERLYVDKLMGRLVMLPVAQQEQIISEITSEFNALVSELDEKGTNPLKSRLYDVKARIINPENLEGGAVVDDHFTSSFDKCVRRATMEYEIFSHPKTAKGLKVEISNGMEYLQRRLLTDCRIRMNKKSPLGEFAERIANERMSRLKSALPAKFANVEAALADTGQNVVKNLDYKLGRLMEILPELKPGTVFNFTNFEGQSDKAVVVGINPPSENLWHLPGQYEIHYSRPGYLRQGVTTLHSLFSDNNFSLLGEVNKEIYQEFDSHRGGGYTVTRDILDGNLFRASEMAIHRQIGTSAIYTDEQGQNQRAIVLPLNTPASAFLTMPLRVHDPEMLADFFTQHENAHMNSLGVANEQGKLTGVLVRRQGSRIRIDIPGAASWMQWLRSNNNLLKVTGEFVGDRNGLMATVPFDEASALFKALYETGTTLYTCNDYQRHWFAVRMGMKSEAPELGKGVVVREGVDPLANLGKRKKRRMATTV